MGDRDIFFADFEMEELENYRYQLSQIEDKLAADTGNEELMRLRNDLKELIELTATMAGVEPFPHKSFDAKDAKSQTEVEIPQNSSTEKEPIFSTEEYAMGDLVEAKWSGNGKYYDARIESKHPTNPSLYSVTFIKYGNTEFVSIQDMRKPDMSKRTVDSFARQKRDKEVDAQELERRQKKKQKQIERVQRKEQEASSKQNSWLKFSQKKNVGSNRAIPYSIDAKKPPSSLNPHRK